jgi:hypothetical protein
VLPVGEKEEGRRQDKVEERRKTVGLYVKSENCRDLFVK